ncbi:hypothetical protein K1W69_10755 [Hoeflea sp. WL0058]|uniref:Uncharacterized protein n=1 Tax=Flavimaribacter sediminis TaxID=2865987 RepID=A0AAE2ZMX8_9HYPH|nr:hypothetical protein [Flavimaribacter sediminis]MBW8637666.1 hypothetical protein [Flavimaribacter sediminis]
MPSNTRETRVQIMFDEEELAAIDDWRFSQRMPSRAAAVRKLLRLGMQAAKLPMDPKTRSKDFGIVRDDDPDEI